MSTDLIKGIISFMATAIPAVISIVGLARRWLEKKAVTNDPLLIVKLIKRYPVDQKLWKKVRRGRQFLILYFIFNYCYMTFSFISLMILYNYDTTASLIFFFTIIILTIILIIVAKTYRPYQTLVNVEDVKYFCFREIEIVIETDYRYLFNKCQEALKKLKFSLIEVNEGQGKIEACHTTFQGWDKITILLERDAVNAYKMLIQYDRLPGGLIYIGFLYN